MAELADALDSGSSARKGVGVRVLFSALAISGYCHLRFHDTQSFLFELIFENSPAELSAVMIGLSGPLQLFEPSLELPSCYTESGLQCGGRLRRWLRSTLQTGSKTGNKVSASETDLPASFLKSVRRCPAFLLGIFLSAYPRWSRCYLGLKTGEHEYKSVF